MLTPKEFADRWKPKKSLVKISKDAAARLAIADDQKRFLLEAGLPDEAAPFLSFEFPKKGELPTAAGLFMLPAKFERYLVIGYDGEGSPIAVDTEKSGAIVLLDHEEKFARIPLNSGVRQLAESLLAFRLTVEDAGGFDDDGELPAKSLKQLHGQLKKIDAPALKVGCFWPQFTQQADGVGREYPATVLKELASPDPKTRLKAAKHLESELRKGVTAQRKQWFGNKQATGPLIAALRDENPQIVHYAVVALSQISYFFRDDAAYEPLKKLIKSKFPLTQRWALGGALRVRGEDSLDDVLPLAKDKSAEAREWVFTHLTWWARENDLEKQCSPANLARLRAVGVKGLGDQAQYVRSRAAFLLSVVGDEKSLATMQKLLAKNLKSAEGELRDDIARLQKKLQLPKAK